MTASLYLHAQFVRAEIGKLLDRFPELKEDPELRLDAIEGETDAHRIISRALSERQEAQMMVDAIGARVTDLAGRRARYERKGEFMKELIRGVMKAAKLDKLALPEATVSILPGRSSVGISDLNELPQGFYKTSREADKAAIKKALDAGEDVPGAHMVIGSEGLSIRPK
jgi:hypothetical protein